MKYLGRTHGVSSAYLTSRLNDNSSGLNIKKCESSARRADIFTKTFAQSEWKRVRTNINVLSDEELNDILIDGGTRIPYIGEDDIQVPYVETIAKESLNGNYMCTPRERSYYDCTNLTPEKQSRMVDNEGFFSDDLMDAQSSNDRCGLAEELTGGDCVMVVGSTGRSLGRQDLADAVREEPPDPVSL